MPLATITIPELLPCCSTWAIPLAPPAVCGGGLRFTCARMWVAAVVVGVELDVVDVEVVVALELVCDVVALAAGVELLVDVLSAAFFFEPPPSEAISTIATTSTTN